MESIDIQQSGSSTLSQNLRGLVREIRPQEWVKNLLVFSGLIFSGSLNNSHDFWFSIFGFLIFCAASSSIYIFNDLCDLKEDRQHPVKALRPLASGILNANVARFTALTLFLIALAAGFALGRNFFLVVLAYLGICLTYSLGLKDLVILDAIMIASGFVIRAVAGAILINVEVSEWLVLCSSMVALLIAFGKRRHELLLLSDMAGNHRRSLNYYSIDFLNSVMNICSAGAVITYAIYARADQTVARVGSRGMLFTIPFVIYGVFRYLFLIQTGVEGGNPVQILYRDRASAINLLLWILASAAVIYLPKIGQF